MNTKDVSEIDSLRVEVAALKIKLARADEWVSKFQSALAEKTIEALRGESAAIKNKIADGWIYKTDPLPDSQVCEIVLVDMHDEDMIPITIVRRNAHDIR